MTTNDIQSRCKDLARRLRKCAQNLDDIAATEPKNIEGSSAYEQVLGVLGLSKEFIDWYLEDEWSEMLIGLNEEEK